MDKKYYDVVYHIGHYGFFLKFLEHKIIHHSRSRALFLIDSGTMSNSTYNFLLRKKQQLRKYGDIEIYNDLTFFCNELDKERLISRICSFFEGVQSKNNTYIGDVTEIYSGADARNAFGVYLCLKDKYFIMCDIGHTVIKNHRQIKVTTPGERIYANLIEEYKTVHYTCNHAKAIMWTNSDAPEIPKSSYVVNFSNLLNELNHSEIQSLLILFEINLNLTKKTCVSILICNSTGILVWGNIKKRDYFQLYRDIVSYSKEDHQLLIVKCHPNFELSKKELCREYPNAIHLPGYVPFELISKIPNILVESVITAGSTASQICGAESFDYGLLSFKHVSDLHKYVFIAHYLNERKLHVVNSIGAPELFDFITIISKTIFNYNPLEDYHIDKKILITDSQSTFVNSGNEYESVICINPESFSWDYSIDITPIEISCTHDTYLERSFVFIKTDKHIDVNKVCANYYYELKYSNSVVRSQVITFFDYLSLSLSNSIIASKMALFDSKTKIVNEELLCWSLFFINTRYKLEIIDKLLTQSDEACLNTAYIILNNLKKTVAISIRLAQLFNNECWSGHDVQLAYYWFKRTVSYNKYYLADFVNFLIKSNIPKYQEEGYNLSVKKMETHPELSLFIARCYRDGIVVDSDLNKAIKYYALATVQDISTTGEYVDVLVRINTYESLHLAFDLCLAVADKDSGAMIRLGRLYKSGLGIESDIHKSIFYYKMGVNKGALWAFSEYCDLLWKTNTKETDEELISILNHRLKMSDQRVFGRLGRAYYYGRGVEKDLTKAKEFFELASAKSPYWSKEKEKLRL